MPLLQLRGSLHLDRLARSVVPPSSQIGIRSKWAQDVIRGLHQQSSHKSIALFADPKLRIAFP